MRYFYLLLLFSFACSQKPVEGVVVSKHYEPAREYTTSEYDPVLKLMVVKRKVDDEDYVLMIKPANENKLKRVEVSKTLYDRYRVGGNYKQ